MKLISYRHRGTARWGAVTGADVVDLGRRLPDIGSVRALLAAGAPALDRARAAIAGGSVDHALADVELRLPVTDPAKIFCIGVNYAHRNAEYKDGSELPKYPSIFMRVADSFVAHGGSLRVPPESRQLDYEGEIGIVIGRGGRRISRDDAAGPHRRPHLHQRGHDPRLGPPRQVQRHPGQELARLRRDRAVDRHRRRVRRGLRPRARADPRQRRSAPGRHHRAPDVRLRLPGLATSRPSPRSSRAT